MIFDVLLLIMRDADLYDDVAIFVKKHSGGLGVLVMRIGELLVGPDMASLPTDKRSVRQNKKTTQRPLPPPPTEKERAQVKRELTENCKQTLRFSSRIIVCDSSRSGVVSELLASMVLFTMIATDTVLDASGVPGFGSVLKDPSDPTATLKDDIHTRRKNALAVYTVIMLCQIIGIFISHQIIHHKNSIIANLHAIRVAKANQPIDLPPGCRWHFFLVCVSILCTRCLPP
jgi:hypothetical protein